MLLLSQDSSIYVVGLYCFVVGLGLGLVAAPTLIAAQSSVTWQRRGVVTGANVFARSMGSAVGVAVFGAIANASMSVRAGAPSSGTAADVPVPVLAAAIHHVFIAAAVVGVLMVAAVLVMPGRVDIVD
jgi:hypothetical protein